MPLMLNIFLCSIYLFIFFNFTSACKMPKNLTDFPKPSDSSVNSSSKAAWELKMTFLNPSGNLCMIPKRLYIGQFFPSLFPSRPFCGSAHTFQYFSVTHDQR